MYSQDQVNAHVGKFKADYKVQQVCTGTVHTYIRYITNKVLLLGPTEVTDIDIDIDIDIDVLVYSSVLSATARTMRTLLYVCT